MDGTTILSGHPLTSSPPHTPIPEIRGLKDDTLTIRSWVLGVRTDYRRDCRRP